nr:vascular endothelial growth factor receptor 1-like [Megalopta genalis]
MLCRRRRFLFAVTLLSYLCRDSTAIIDVRIIKEGSNFTLECFVQADIFFIYPTNRTHSDSVFSYTSPIEISKTQDENGTNHQEFYRARTVFGDTGWYGCSRKPFLNTRDNYFNPEIIWTYIYVQSKTVRFVEQAKSHILTTTIGENIDLPCRPTSPTAIVKLSKYYRNGSNEIVPPCTFDPKIGFTLYKVDKFQSGLYVCTIAPDQQVSYNVIVTEEYTLPKPVINATLLHVRKGESLYLKCSVVPSGLKHYNILWILQRQNDRTTTWSNSRSTENKILENMALLKVTNVTYNDEGIYECSVKEGIYERNTRTYVQVHDNGDFGVVLTNNTVAEGDECVLICAASIRNYLDNFNWSIESGPIVQSDRISIDRGRTQLAYRSILKIQNAKIEDSQEYICTGTSTGNLTRSTGYRLEVKAARAPLIVDTNLNKNEIIIDVTTPGHKAVGFHCFAEGMPKPSITWFKDGAQLAVSNAVYKFSKNSQKLELEYPLEVDSGVYVCRAENRIGKVEVSQRLTIKGFGIGSIRTVGLIISIAVLAVVVLILVIYFANMFRRERISRQQLMEAGPVQFQRQANESFKPNLYVDDPANLARHS